MTTDLPSTSPPQVAMPLADAPVLRPVRFTERPEEMRDFLELLGLVPRIEAERGGWVDLVGTAGMVALHDAASSDVGAAPGDTLLSFEVRDADTLAHLLRTQGFREVAVVDEAYGRVLGFVDPLGQRVLVDERSEDLYGYRRHPAGTPTAGVEAVRFTDDVAACHRALGALGLTGAPIPGDYAVYRTSGDHGSVGVHPVHGDDVPTAPPGEAPVRIAFRTDVEQVAARLEERGLDAGRCEESFGTILRLTDPDGEHVEVHPWLP